MASSRNFENLFTRRAALVGLGGGAAWMAFIARLVELQIYKNEDFENLAKENRINLVMHPPLRGIIYDRFQIQLATHRRAGRVSITPEIAGDIEHTLDQLSRIIPISKATRKRVLREAARRAKFVPIIIDDNLSYEEFAKLNIHRPDLIGVSADVAETRSYPFGPEFAHLMGYVARANARDLARLGDLHKNPDEIRALQRLFQHPDMRVGRQGVEWFAEDWLRGIPGFQRVVVNSMGRVIEELPSHDIAPISGKNVVLSLDSELQRIAFARLGNNAGSVVVMDVQSADILAITSKPAFDPNNFVIGISHDAYNQLLTHPQKPLFHKAYDGAYPPGSTFKMAVAAAALEHKVISPEETIMCQGKIEFGGQNFHCWKRGGHGLVDLHGAIKHSCDIYFYEIGRRLGAERIADAARRFGLGASYGLGMTGGTSGVVPDDKWKRNKLGKEWYEGETLIYGIGQGALTASPLQLAVMATSLARGGKPLTPRLILDGPAVENKHSVEPGYRKEIYDKLQAGMLAVTSDSGGTATASGDLGLDGIKMAGKSGTAQVRRITQAERLNGVIDNADLPWRLRDHAIFIAYAPADAPRYACAVTVEHGGSGSKVAAPIARDILREALVRNSGRKAKMASSIT